MTRVVASIEARMGSSRLPGKVLSDVCGKPALSRLIARLRRCELLDGIVLATSTNKKDDVLIQWAETEGVECHRGSEDDVLKRVVEAHQKMASDIVVEVCGDMVLLDPTLVDLGIKTFMENECEVVTTTCKPSYPIGVDVQVFRLADLEWVENNIFDSKVREHVSLFFYRWPDKYRAIHLHAPPHMNAPEYRFVLDYPEDLAFIRQVYSRLVPKHGDDFGLAEIMDLLNGEPRLVEINRLCEEKYQH